MAVQEEHNFGGLNLRGLTIVGLASAGIAGILLEYLLRLPPLMIAPGIGLTGILLFLYWQSSSKRLVLCCTLFALAGMWRAGSALPEYNPRSIHALLGQSLEIEGHVTDQPRTSGRSRTLHVEVESIRLNKQSWQGADGQIEVQSTGTQIEDPYGANYGDRVILSGQLHPPDPIDPPNITASMSFPRITVKSAEGNPLMSALYHLRVIFATVLAQALPQPEAALLIAIVLGLRTPGLRPLNASFAATGTAHLIAPSGFKVTLLAGLITRTASRYIPPPKGYRWLLPAQRRRAWQPWLSTLLSMAGILAFTILNGAGAAAIRSGIMGSLLILAPRINRRYNVYAALAVAAFIMILFDPFIVWDVSFQLSFLGTLGVVLLTPLYQHLLSLLDRFPGCHYLLETLAVTLAAQTATLPIIAITFKQVSFIAPLANLLTVPLLGILLFQGLSICAAGLIYVPLAQVCSWLSWPLLWYLITCIRWCFSIPGAYIEFNTSPDNSIACCYYALLAVFLCSISLLNTRLFIRPASRHAFILGLSQPTIRLAQVALALLIILATGTAALTTRANGMLSLTFLNVAPEGEAAQGEALLLRTTDGKTILIDGGPDITSLGEKLDSRLPYWQRSLDMLILTNPGPDHLNALQDIALRYQIDTVIDGGMLHPSTTYALWRRTISERNFPYREVSQGIVIPLGAQLVLQVLWPGQYLHKGSNELRDNTLVIRLVTPTLRILLLGATAQSTYALTGLLNTVASNYLQAEIVQVMGEVQVPFSMEVTRILEKVRPTLVIITPALFNTQQRKQVSTALPLPWKWKTLQTSRDRPIEIISDRSGWHMF